MSSAYFENFFHHLFILRLFKLLLDGGIMQLIFQLTGYVAPLFHLPICSGLLFMF